MLFQLCRSKWNKGLTLLYRASFHGFRAYDFHAQCDPACKTFTIIKTTNGDIFGGYTEVSWVSGFIGCPKLDPNAFVFSLVNKENAPMIARIANKDLGAIVCNNGYGPIFGSGFVPDICISNESNKNMNSYCNFGNSYFIPNHLGSSSLKAKYFFKVEEIEVFSTQG